MAKPVAMKDVDPAFQGAGQKPGLEIWRIENFSPVPVPTSSHGKFFTGDSYLILKTMASKSGALHHDIHYWLGKETSQDEAGAAAMKTVELDASLGGKAVQYREVQGKETEKFLSYFKPCIIPQPGGVASGFKHAEVNDYEHETRLFVCRGKHMVHVEEVSFARTSLGHDDIYILDAKTKIFQFNGSKSSIQERAKALEVVQYIKDTYHDGKCDVAAVEDGKLMADADAGEFWALFGGFAPLPRKPAVTEEGQTEDACSAKLLCVDNEQPEQVEADSLTRDLLETDKCYILDCGIEIFVWMGKNSPLEKRKHASSAAEELVRSPDRPKSHVIRVMEGFETVMFRSKFDSWPETTAVKASEGGRGKVAELLKRQGVDVKGLVKSEPVEEEAQLYIDCTGDLQVWRINGEEKTLLSSTEQSKFYTGDCYIFQYAYTADDREEFLIGTWFGKCGTEEERAAAILLADKMVESLKHQAAQVRLYEGNEPIQFYCIFQSLIVYKGGLSTGYKNYISENELNDETYKEDGTALFRIQGSGPDNMQAIQVDTVASSLNSSYCFILHSGNTVFNWTGSFTTPEDQNIVERQLDIIKPEVQSRPQKEGAEFVEFWEILGGKQKYSGKKIKRVPEQDARLFYCDFSNANLKIKEIFNFTQDDLMTEDIFILDCHSDIFVWVGQQVDSKTKSQALTIGEKFLENDFLMERISRETPIYIITEGNEPQLFTRFFSWDSAKSAMHGNSYERKLAILKDGRAAVLDKPRRRIPTHGAGRSSIPDKSTRSRSMSFSPDKAKVRGRSPAFNALAAQFENRNPRTNLSMPPPMDRKIHPLSVKLDATKLSSKSAAIAALTSNFESPKNNIPRSPVRKPKKEETIQEEMKEGEAAEDDELEKLPTFPYGQLRILSEDPAPDIDITKREAYLSSEEFREKFNMDKVAFYKLPKWKQNKLKMAVHLY